MTIETDVRHGSQATSADAQGASTGPKPTVHRAGPSRALVVLAAMVVLFALALGLRLIGLGGAVTEDEDQWIGRSGVFARSLASADWGRTYLTGHPGVTVMWLTSGTLGLDRAAALATRPGIDVTTRPDFLPALRLARLPFAVAQAFLVVAAALMVGRLFGPSIGLLAGLLLAAEPFWAGVGPIVGMDGLLSGLLTVSLLALMLALQSGAGRRERLTWAAVAGVSFGLAFVTKTSALLAGPLVPILAGVAAWQCRADPQSSDRVWWQRPAGVVAVWGALAALTIWLVWPAAWTSPLTTVSNALSFSAELGGSPHRPGNVFFGQPVEDPGPVFYPVALGLRLGPGTMVGLLMLLAFGAPAARRRPTWTLLGFVVLFLGLLTFAPKKVDRYLLPTLPMLGILGAVGWYEAARRLHRLSRRGPSPDPSPLRRRGETSHSVPPLPCAGEGGRGRGLFLVAVLALALQVWPLVVAGRYPLAAYNPLFGGSAMAERAIPVGWGDGLDVAGDRLRDLAGGQIAAGQTVVTAIWAPLRVNFGAHAPGPVVSQAQIGEADFYVDYVHARQRHLTPRQVANREPDAVVTINGVDYARVYRLR